MPIDPTAQQPCIHCGDCARVCPEALDPETLFFALAGDDWPKVHSGRLDACSECNRCTEACPSHIPLLDWLRWGKSELHVQAQADAARARFLARSVRLDRQREERAARRHEKSSPATLPTQSISRSEVLAAIARGRAKVRAIVPDRRVTESPATRDDKTS